VVSTACGPPAHRGEPATAQKQPATVIVAPTTPTASASNEDHPANAISAEALRLPRCPGRPLSSEDAIVVRVSKTGVTIDGTAIVNLSVPEVAAEKGIYVSAKRNGPNDLVITPMTDFLREKRQNRTRSLVSVDAGTGFRVLFEVVYSLSQSGVTDFGFPTDDDSFRPPGRVRGWATSAPTSDGVPAVLVLLVNEGFSVRLAGAPLTPGCREIGRGVAVPKVQAAYDYAGLGQCLASARHRLDGTPVDPRSAWILANPGTPFEQVAWTMKTVHEAGFTAQAFKIPR
jgi:hypothetical protein